MAFALHFFGSAMAEHGWTVESQETLYETDDTHFLSVGVACISRFFFGTEHQSQPASLQTKNL